MLSTWNRLSDDSWPSAANAPFVEDYFAGIKSGAEFIVASAEEGAIGVRDALARFFHFRPPSIRRRASRLSISAWNFVVPIFALFAPLV